ncbi:DHH family phosphoesterase [Vibrio gallaecicus]|uniref:DHH family phosphoesterase n=1 Tax=Vibrio gallaecicus TaxID=552386 RepID=A0ABV4NG08_9VIBR
MNYDVFNGDADGIISLIQLRLAQPKTAKLVTGVKRNVELLANVDACEVNTSAGDEVLVLDVSLDKNKDALNALLESGAKVTYFDHHKSGDIPTHPNLTCLIDLDPNTCTALIVNKQLEDQFVHWAIAGAYGDNLLAVADELANQYQLSVAQQDQLKELGTLINYNGYGREVSDLHFDPAELYKKLLNYRSPFDVIDDPKSPFHVLQKAYAEDWALVESLTPLVQTDVVRVFELPDTAASRRISGVYGNYLANQNPECASVVLTSNSDLSYTVSLRAPLNNKQGAVKICGSFKTGGGREAAAGINQLEKHNLNTLIKMTHDYYVS